MEKVICPYCKKVNGHANEVGAVDGPREYHADCWSIVDAKRDAKRDAQEAVDEINEYQGDNV